MFSFDRYTVGARFYDALSGESIVYRKGRLAAMDLLDAQTGDVVLDLGCGTGLNLPLLSERVGPTGLVIAIDFSAQMLAMARARNLPNVRIEQADATRFDPAWVAGMATAVTGRPGVDAVLSTYAMSVFPDWRAAWSRASAALRPGGQAIIVDMQYPVGRAAVFSPLARLACALGGADITAHPWKAIERDGHDLRRATRAGGHIQVVAGTIGTAG